LGSTSNTHCTVHGMLEVNEQTNYKNNAINYCMETVIENREK